MAVGLALSGYNYKIEFIRGRTNTCADMLSRINHKTEETDYGLPLQEDIYDNSYQINYINTNQTDTRGYVNAQIPISGRTDKPVLNKPDINMSEEQIKDNELRQIKEQLRKNETTKTTYAQFIVIDVILYYTSNRDKDPLIRLCIPETNKRAIKKERGYKNHICTIHSDR